MPVSSDGSLTPRELEIAGCVAAGMSNREIAASLGISLRTVENKVLVALGKTHSADRHALSVWYWKEGIKQ